MKITGQELEAIKREVERDVRGEIARELRHMASHEGEENHTTRMLLLAASSVQAGLKLWHW